MDSLAKPVSVDKTSGFKQSLLELDADPNAERFMLIDRNTAKTIYHHLVPAGGLVRVALPYKYALAGDLLVVIIDDSGEFNAVCMDGVKLQELDPFTATV
ncbi:conserved protein of unknown function [Shewanella benthica]|uniref:Uncharacterized protein n=1 Tax=Shewanella benthica TaxID=43661 RepID=A0A330M6B6_9GAMM|nr:hypothetical protein [Shewanella benthica]SQH76934.1 conserved protein of unknown function [Shewanella benthica]